MSHTLRFDGGSNPNPGPTAGAFVIYKNEQIRSKGGSFLSKGTNNIGEYTGLLKGLEKCIELGITDLDVEGDSLLVISQVKGEWKINQEHLKILCDQIKDLVKQFTRITFRHIRREFNCDADKMSDLILEKKQDLFFDEKNKKDEEKIDEDKKTNELIAERMRLISRVHELDDLISKAVNKKK